MKKSEFLLPGFGVKSKENCNKIISVNHCTDCKNTKPLYYHCKKWTCPDCYITTASRSAHRIEDRLLGITAAYSKICISVGKIVHLTFSPPQDNLEKLNLKDLEKELKEHLKNVGVLGGMYCFHPFRISTKYKKDLSKLLKMYKEEHGERYKGGFFKFVHENPLNLTNHLAYFDLAPHFHIVGYYPHIKIKSNEFELKTGWVYKAIGIKYERSAYRTAFYQLTHHNVKCKTTYKYFGLCEPNRTEVNEEKFKKLIPCENCGSNNYFKFRCSNEEYTKIVAGELKITVPLSVSEGGNIPHVWENKFFRVYTVRLKTKTFLEYLEELKVSD